MSNWTLSLSDPWFKYVGTGQKTFEGRLNRGLPKYFKAGDTIRFYHETNTDLQPLNVEVVKIHHFASFADSLSQLPLDQILPEIKSVEEGTAVYFKFASKESQIKLGVCQIEIKLMSQ
jgi:ASC-1-like (ASCH) protein